MGVADNGILLNATRLPNNKRLEFNACYHKQKGLSCTSWSHNTNGLRSQHVSESTPLLFGSQQVHRPSISEQRHWRAGRRDQGLQAVLESRVESYESGELGTNCLKNMIRYPQLKNKSYWVLLFKTSKQMRPRRSMLGWQILVRKRILGGVIGQSSGRKSSSRKIPPVESRLVLQLNMMILLPRAYPRMEIAQVRELRRRNSGGYRHGAQH